MRAAVYLDRPSRGKARWIVALTYKVANGSTFVRHETAPAELPDAAAAWQDVADRVGLTARSDPEPMGAAGLLFPDVAAIPAPDEPADPVPVSPTWWDQRALHGAPPCLAAT